MHPGLVTTEHVKLLYREMQMNFQLIISLLPKQFYKQKYILLIYFFYEGRTAKPNFVSREMNKIENAFFSFREFVKGEHVDNAIRSLMDRML